MNQSVLRRLGAAFVLIIALAIFHPSFAAPQQVESVGSAAVPADPAAAPSPAPVPNPAPQAAADQTAPLQLKIGDTTIIPIGFLDITNTFRSTNSGAGFATNFGNIPYPNAGFLPVPASQLTEDRFSMGNSRIGFRMDTKVKNTNVMAYMEADFVGGIGNGAFNTQVSSNSLLPRIRLFWVDLRKGKFEFLAGQSWSMLTPNRKQISALPGDLFYGQVYDVNYINGLTWGRIPGLRILAHPSEKVTWGLSFENASQYFGGSGGAGIPTLPAALAAPMAFELDQNVSNGQSTPNVFPDIISRLAFDPNSHVHFELTGMEDTLKLYNPVANTSFNKSGGGGSLNGNFEIAKGFRLITNNYWSDGGGRYIFGQSPNFIVRADGSPSMIHSGSTIQGFEFTHKNTLIYGYYGGVAIKRNTALDANGTTKIGYGYAGSANSQNRTTQEGTVGLTQTFWRDPKYGALQLMVQYAYFFRDPWNVPAGSANNTHQNTVWFNIRYALPGAAPAIKY